MDALLVRLFSGSLVVIDKNARPWCDWTVISTGVLDGDCFQSSTGEIYKTRLSLGIRLVIRE